MTTTIERALDEPRVGAEGKPQRVGGLAAFYLALALLAAIPYFLLVVDYPGATTAADKVALIAERYSSMYVMYLATYVFFGIAIGVLALSLWDRLRSAPLQPCESLRGSDSCGRSRSLLAGWSSCTG